MAKSNCNIISGGVEDLKALEDAVKKATITKAEILGVQDIIEDADIHFALKELVKGVIPEKDFDKFILKKYGKPGERYLLAAKINALIAGNEIIGDMVYEMIIEFMTSGTTRGKVKKPTTSPTLMGLFDKAGKEIKYSSKEKKMLRQLKAQSKETLMIIYYEALNFATAGLGENWGQGVVGNLVTQFFVPKQLAKKERTGAYFWFASHMRRFHTNIEENIGNFMYDREIKVGPDKFKQFKGMETVFREIEDMANTVKMKRHEDDYRTDEEIMIEFFIMNMNGEIFYDKKSKQFMAYSVNGTVLKADGKTLDAYPDGTLKQKFSVPVTLDKFQEGTYNIRFTKTQRDKLAKLLKQGREIDDRVFKTGKKKFLESVELMKKPLRKHFPNLTESEVELLFFEDWKIKKHAALLKKITEEDKKHKTTYMNTYNTLVGTFGKYASTNQYFTQAHQSEYKRYHFPVKYPTHLFAIMWDGYIDDLEKKIKVYRKALKTAEGQAIHKIEWKIKTTEQALIRAIEIKKRKEDEYGYDIYAMKEIAFAKDHRHLKRITNAFDVRLMRKDKAVYYDHLQDVFSGIERNLLTATLLESLLKAKSQGVVNTLINYYKVPFNDPSVEGGFAFLKVSDESLSGILNGVRIKLSPEYINRLFARMNKWLTWAKLGGISTAVVNQMAIVHTIVDRNIMEYNRASQKYMKNKGKIDNFIAKIGVASFQDFFSKSMVNNKLGFQADDATVNRIYAVMLNYPSLKQNFMNLSKSKLRAYAKDKEIVTTGLDKDSLVEKIVGAEMKLQYSKVLKNSTAYNLIVKRMLNKEQINKRLKKVKIERFDTMLNTLVDYSLTKELELNRYAEYAGWKYLSPKKIIHEGGGAVLKFIGLKLKGMRMTMSDGEGWLRSMSAIMGVLKAQDIGLLRKDINFWEFTGDDLKEAGEMGRLISEFSNMGLTRTDVSATAYGPLGTMQKFNFWGLQRRGREHRILKYMYLVQKDLHKLGKTRYFDGKAIAKTIGKSLTFGKDMNKMNIAQKQQAQYQKFLLTGVLPALLLDFVVLGTLGTVAFFSMLRNIMKLGGVESGLRGLPSPTARMISIPLAFAMKMSWGMDDDDEDEKAEETQRFITRYIRNMGFGFGVSWSREVWLLAMEIFSRPDENKPLRIGEQAVDVLSPLLPTVPPIGPDIVTITKDIVKSAIELKEED